MTRRAALPVVLVLLAACAPGTDATTSTTAAPTTTAEASTTTTTAGTTTTEPPTSTTTTPAADLAVVLVTADDVLNVRDAPMGSIVATLGPTATGISPTGATSDQPSGTWVEIAAPAAGWVNGHYLTPEVPDADFASAASPADLADDLLAWAQQGSCPPWPDLVGPKGFTVVHFDPPKHWPPGQNPFLDPTVYGWGGEAAGPGVDVANATFADEIGQSFVGVAADPDLQVAVDQPLQGPEAAPPYLPVPFQNFHSLAFHDPGDDQNVDGLDWTTWNVYFELTGGTWVLVGMSIDRWAP